MKIIIITAMFFAFLIVPAVSRAQTTTPPEITETPVTKVTPVQKSEVENLKDKIESKVAELAKKTRKAVAGEITQVGKSSFTIDSGGVKYNAKINSDLTQFFSISGTSKKEVDFSDFEKGDYIIVSGPISESEVTANVIYKDQPYLAQTGKIVEVDKASFVVRVLAQDKQEYMLDIENTTSQQILNIKTLESEKIGFSKIKEGDVIQFVFEKGESNKNRYAAKRIFIIPQEYFGK